MALQSSGQISFSNIRNEFGESPVGIGSYRVLQTIGDHDFPLDEGIPTSGEIKFSDFYDKKLNVVVHYGYNTIGVGETEIRPNNAKTRYNSDEGVTVVGEYTNKPSQTNGKKIIIHVSNTLGSQKVDYDNLLTNGIGRERCALRTGDWDAGTQLDIEIGAEALVSGAGGNGGRAGQGEGSSGVGGWGKSGTSAIGLEYQTTRIRIQSGGIVQGGGGGGGGGEGDEEGGTNTWGGGGGGGAGIPFGIGGPGRNSWNTVADGFGGTFYGGEGQYNQSAEGSFGGSGGGGACAFGYTPAGTKLFGTVGGTPGARSAQPGTALQGGRGGRAPNQAPGPQANRPGGLTGFSITSINGVVIPNIEVLGVGTAVGLTSEGGGVL